MRVYNIHTHEYATVLNRTKSYYAVRYDGDNQIYSAPISYFEVAR
jgi:hypothetical protein